MSDYLRTNVKLLEDAAGFSTWEVKLRDILVDQDYGEYVFGSLTDEPKVNDEANADEVKARQEWRTKQSKALAMIRLRVGDGPMPYIRGATTAKQAWDKLQSIYAPKGAITIIHLRRRLYSLRCGEEEPIEGHLRTLATLRTDLEKYGVTLSEPDFAIIILTSLPDSWDHWTGNFDLTQVKESEDLISRVIQHAKQPSAKPENETSSTALAAFKGKSGSSHTHDSSRPGACFHCGRLGHRADECRAKQAGKSFSEKEKQRNFEYKSKHNKGKSGGTKANLAQEPQQDVVFMAQAGPTLTKDSWLLDSGASVHITNNKSHFFAYSALM
uniref:Polyprotein n=1 Tax=Mycena chlorophos TaxID=658473 RepID=A0ABQ0L2K6_MYCCL|nr:polyprotein [Mycena chlorophos]